MTPAPHVIVLSIEGLRASALGAYGNAWRPTPQLDRLASQAVLCEWALAPTPAPLVALLNDVADGPWGRQRLVTDDLRLVQEPVAKRFTETTPLELPKIDDRAASVEGTASSAVFAAFADILAEQAATDSSAQPTSPQLTWLHHRGLAGPWDAPWRLVEELIEEDDPTPPATVDPAAASVDRTAEPDEVFSAACRYTAQIAVLDACLEDWLAALAELVRSRPTLLVLTGSRGYALGEHGQIGLQEAGPYGESRHVPLLFLTGAATIGYRWGDAPWNLANLPQLLANWATKGGTQRIETSLANTATDSIALTASQATAIRTADWHAVLPTAADGPAELYLKPDDRWEANDVASLRPEVIEQLRDSIAGAG